VEGIELIGAAVAAYYGQYQLAASLAAAALGTDTARRAEDKARRAYNASLRDRYTMSRSTQAARQLVFGRCRVSGPVFFIASYGDDRQHLAMCIALAAHEIDAIETVYFDDRPVMLDGSGNVTGILNQDVFSITAPTAAVDLTKNPRAGSVTAQARYGSTTVPLTVTAVTGTNVSVSGARSGETGELDIFYAGDPDPIVPTGVDSYTERFPITSAGQTFTLARNPDSGSVHAVYVATSATSNDASPITIASVTGNTVTVSGATVGRTAAIYYQAIQSLPAASKARVRKFLGLQTQTADGHLTFEFPGVWTNAHTATGVAYLVVELDYDENAFIGGIPNVSAVVRGMKCYDPRTGTTAWTENPALHARALATHSLAGNLPASSIDDDAVAAAANVCDTVTTYTVGDADFTRELYKAGYAFTVDRKPMDGLTDLCQAMGGDWVFADGMLRVVAGSYRVPVMDLDESWLVDDQPVQIQVGNARADLVNTTTGSIADQDQDWRMVPIPRIAPDAYLAADGATLARDIEYAAVTFSGQAQYLSSTMLRRMRQGLLLKVRCNMRAWQAERFDNLNVTLNRFGFDAKPFEVIESVWTTDGSIDLTLRETTPIIWDMDAGFDANDIAPNTTMPVPWGLPQITSLAGVSDDSTVQPQSDGTVLPRVSVTWDAVTDGRVLQGGYIEIRYWLMGQSADTFYTAKAQPTDTRLFLDSVRSSVAYLITARTVSVVTHSPWCRAVAVNANGKTIAPSAVTGANCTLGAGRAHFTWDACIDPDYKLTEIRYGASWAAGTLIGTSAGTSIDWLSPPVGAQTIWFANQNFSGVYSTAVSLSVTIDASVNGTAAGYGVNNTIGNLFVEADTTPHTVPAFAAIKFDTTGFVARRSGDSSSTYTNLMKWCSTTTVGSFLIRFDVISPPSGGTLSGTFSLQQTLDASNSQTVQLSATNATPTAYVAYTIFDSTGAVQLATGSIKLTANSTD
jgi:hypothetical protein